MRPVGARERGAGGHARDLRDAPRPRAHGRGRAASARTSSTASTWCGSRSRRCASAATTSRCSCTTSCASTAARTRRSRASRTRRWSCWSRPSGRATCASSRTRSSRRWRSRGARACAPRICRAAARGAQRGAVRRRDVPLSLAAYERLRSSARSPRPAATRPRPRGGSASAAARSIASSRKHGLPRGALAARDGGYGSRAPRCTRATSTGCAWPRTARMGHARGAAARSSWRRAGRAAARGRRLWRSSRVAPARARAARGEIESVRERSSECIDSRARPLRRRAARRRLGAEAEALVASLAARGPVLVLERSASDAAALAWLRPAPASACVRRARRRARCARRARAAERVRAVRDARRGGRSRAPTHRDISSSAARCSSSMPPAASRTAIRPRSRSSARRARAARPLGLGVVRRGRGERAARARARCAATRASRAPRRVIAARRRAPRAGRHVVRADRSERDGDRSGAVAVFQDLSDAKQLAHAAAPAREAGLDRPARRRRRARDQQPDGLHPREPVPDGGVRAGPARVSGAASRRCCRRPRAAMRPGCARPPRDAPARPRRSTSASCSSDLAKAVRESQEGSERIRHIVQDLRDFSHQDTARARARRPQPVSRFDGQHRVADDETRRRAGEALRRAAGRAVLPDAAEAGVHEPARERLPGDRGGAHRGSAASTGTITLETAPCAGGVLVDGARHRRRHPGRAPRPHLRSLLHHQEGGRRHRARSLDLVRHRAAARRHAARSRASPAAAAASSCSCRSKARDGSDVSDGARAPLLLLVDDEPRILSALRRACAASPTSCSAPRAAPRRCALIETRPSTACSRTTRCRA